jgi:hypothetical protein
VKNETVRDAIVPMYGTEACYVLVCAAIEQATIVKLIKRIHRPGGFECREQGDESNPLHTQVPWTLKAHNE